MNIELMSDHIKYFKQVVIESGFKRDIDDYSTSLPSNQNNVIPLREIAANVLLELERIYQSDLPSVLDSLLPTEAHIPFTNTPHNNEFKDIVENTQTELAELFVKIQKRLAQLKAQIANNCAAIDDIQNFISPYIADNDYMLTKENIATLSIVYRDQDTTTSLTSFSRTLTLWNRILPVYHQLLKSDSPEDIHIVEVQNGSIDLIINLNVDVAVELSKVFKVGFEVFISYLAYKKMIEPITATYFGNKNLIDGEKQREKDLLSNIGDAVRKQIQSQYRAAKKLDKTINSTSIKTRVSTVADLITSHIVRGNDFKLIGLPRPNEENEELSEEDNHSELLREKSLEARRQLRLVPDETRKELLAAFTLKDNETS